MKSCKLGAARKSSSPAHPIFLASDNVETTSSVVYGEPPFMRQDGNTYGAYTARREDAKRTLATNSRPSNYSTPRRTRNITSVGLSRKKSEFDTDRKAPFLLWHQLERKCEEAAVRMLQKGPQGGWFPQMATSKGGESCSHQQQSQSETLIEMDSSDMERSIGGIYEVQEGDADAKFPRAPQITSSTRPPSVDLEIPEEQVVTDATGELLAETDVLSRKTMEATTTVVRSNSPSVCLDVQELDEGEHVDQWNQMEEEAPLHASSHGRNVCTSYTAPLYILISPNFAVADDGPHGMHFDQGCIKCNTVDKKESTPNQDGPYRGLYHDLCGVQSTSTTTPGLGAMKQSPGSQVNKRMIFTPPRPTSEHLLGHCKVISNSDDSANSDTGGAWCRYQKCHTFVTPETEFVSNVNSPPPRRRDSIIGSWHGLNAHCKRAGLRTPAVPFLLRKSQHTL